MYYCTNALFFSNLVRCAILGKLAKALAGVHYYCLLLVYYYYYYWGKQSKQPISSKGVTT